MHNILLINPNTSETSTAMMVEIAKAVAPASFAITGATAAHGAAMITDEAEMQCAAAELPRTWLRSGADHAGVIVSAFGDPGIDTLRGLTPLPVVGICEASIRAAAAGGRRFGIATVTPGLADLIAHCVERLDLGHCYSGIRLTPGSPTALAADPAALKDALAAAIGECIRLDRAETVIIGGGPLARAAAELQQCFEVPLIEPIPAAVHAMEQMVGRDR